MNHKMRVFSLIFSAGLLCAALSGCSSTESASSALTSVGSSAGTNSAADESAGESAEHSDAGADSVPGGDTKEESSTNQPDSASAASDSGQQDEKTESSSVNQSDSQSGSQSGSESSRPIGSGLTFYGDDLKAKAGQKAFPVTVCIKNNPGISFIGLRVIYDRALTVNTDPDDKLTAVSEEGEVLGGMLDSCSVNAAKFMVGFAAYAAKASTIDGKLCTFYVDIPADAPSGTVYTLLPEVAELRDADNVTLTEYDLLDFHITVE